MAVAAVAGLGIGVVGTAVVVGLADGEPAITIGTTAGGPVELVAYDSCESALSELKAAALPHVGPYGFGGGVSATDAEERASAGDGAEDGAEPPPVAPGAADDQAERAPEATPDAAPDAPGGGDKRAPGHSGTNNHESGVDEPDIVKTDGSRIVTAAADGTIRVVDVASREQTAALSIGDGAPGQLLLDGDRALVLTSARITRGEPMPMPGKGGPAHGSSRLVLLDLTGEGEVLGTLEVDGAYLDARQVGSVARVVVRSTPRLEFVHRTDGTDPGTLTEANRQAVLDSSIQDWLPTYTLDTGTRTSQGTLLDCEQVSHPRRYSGSAMLTVLTVDLSGRLTTGDPIGIAADGDTVYGTGTNLYVADDHVTHRIDRPGPAERPIPDGDRRTEIYQFDISKPGRPVHVASGGVEGTLLNQYALSEHEGHLRIATTLGTAPRTSSAVSVLSRRGENLVEVGRVDGLGEGERIYSVRFLGDTGYVVTFRETDPLYTVDLADPARPRVTGELKITGYSAYLHPVGEDRLLGVGQEATTGGRATGTQVSLFDTADPAGARRIGQLHVPGGYSEVESDPHAFLYWPYADLVVVPVSGGATDRGDVATPAGVLVLRLSGDRLDEVGLVSHADDRYGPYGVAPRRALVIGEELWTLSDAGLMVNDLDTLAQVAWLPFD